MTILEYLQKNNITFKSASQRLGVDSSNLSKAVRGKIPVSIALYKKIRTSFLQDCSLDDLILSKDLVNKKPIIDRQVAEELHRRKMEDTSEVTSLDLDLRMTDTDKEVNKIINIDRDLTKEIKESTEEIKKLVEENKKLFRVNFRYAKQFQNALDCLDDLEVQIQLLRSIINRDKYLHGLQNLK